MATDPAATQTLFLGLPDFVWTGILTLFGALGGVMLSNWGNAKSLKRQLKQDREEKAKERLLALRRELYLRAVDTNIRGLAYFGALPQTDLTRPDATTSLQNVMAVNAQLQLVVRQETAQLVSDLIAAYGELNLRLMPKVLPIQNVGTDIKICNEHFEIMRAETSRVLAAMTNYNESGQTDPARFDQLNRAFEHANGRTQELAENSSGQWTKKNALLRQYMKDMMPEVRRLGELQTRLLVELRRELDVGGSVAVFQEMMRRQMERMEWAVDEFDRAVYGDDSPVRVSQGVPATNSTPKPPKCG